MSILGLNILGDRGLSEDLIAANVRDLNAGYHVVMNNPALAERLQKLGTQVIYRHWQGDDNVQDSSDPRERVRLVAQIAPKGCLLYLGNEPRKGVLPQLNAWSATALDECEKLGRKGVILNFATGNPEPAEWELLRTCIERAFNGGHILGLHQYFDRTVANSFPWHIGRERELRAVYGNKTPQIVITELGCAIGYDAQKGWRGSMTSESYAAELRKAAEHYAQQGIHACLFARCNGNDTRWGTFDTSEKVLALMGEANRTVQRVAPVTPTAPVTPNPVPPGESKPASAGTGVPALLQTGTFIRVRSAPTTRGTEIAQLLHEQVITWYPSTVRSADGYEWTYVEAVTPAQTVNGWMARVWQTWNEQFKPVPATQPAPITPQPEPAPVVSAALLAEARDIRASVRQMEQTAEKLLNDTRDIGARLERLIQNLERE